MPVGTGKVALTSENGEIKRNVSFGKSKPELTFLFIISSKEADRKKEYKKMIEEIKETQSNQKKDYKNLIKKIRKRK